MVSPLALVASSLYIPLPASDCNWSEWSLMSLTVASLALDADRGSFLGGC